MNDTIFALATPPGRAAVAVVRLSGSGCAQLLAALTRRPPPPPRQAVLRRLAALDDPSHTLDQALVLWMPAPASYTGEDQAELHLHGGVATVSVVLAALASNGLRVAEPGEFTRRAFANGRLDLAEAEAVADLVDAETEAQRRQALAQLGGVLSAQHAEWRGWLLEAAAHLEAAVDFPDEDLPAETAARAAPALLRLREALGAALDDRRGERVRQGFRVALLGAPNAGKSSLLNAMAKYDAAIVTPIAGTTRDIVEVQLVLAGRKVVIADTAGLRDATDLIEAEGVRRAHAWGKSADLRIWLTEPGGEAPPDGLLGPSDLRLATKADQGAAPGDIAISTITSEGLSELEEWLQERVVAATSGGEAAVVTRQRHRDSLAAALQEVERALAAAAASPELAAEAVRLAGRALKRLTGEVEPEAVLDRVFSSFCIGK